MSLLITAHVSGTPLHTNLWKFSEKQLKLWTCQIITFTSIMHSTGNVKNETWKVKKCAMKIAVMRIFVGPKRNNKNFSDQRVCNFNHFLNNFGIPSCALTYRADSCQCFFLWKRKEFPQNTVFPLYSDDLYLWMLSKSFYFKIRREAKLFKCNFKTQSCKVFRTPW